MVKMRAPVGPPVPNHIGAIRSVPRPGVRANYSLQKLLVLETLGGNLCFDPFAPPFVLTQLPMTKSTINRIAKERRLICHQH